jgi:hypothetical protein
MSEQTTETTTETTTTETAPSWDEAFKGEDPAKVRKDLDHAREWEKRAKQNADAAKRLAEIEEAQKTEAQKAADRLAVAEKAAADATREALKFKVAAKFQIGDEDADLFLTGSDEESLTKQAERLTAREAERKKTGNHVSREGTNPTATGSQDEAAFAKSLFASG